jgi:hypothetical protein
MMLATLGPDDPPFPKCSRHTRSWLSTLPGSSGNAGANSPPKDGEAYGLGRTSRICHRQDAASDHVRARALSLLHEPKDPNDNEIHCDHVIQ